MLTPLSRVDPAVTRLQPVSEQGQQAARRTSQERLAFAGQRENFESKLVSQGRGDTSGRPATVKTLSTPQVVKVNLPGTQGNKVGTASKAPAPLSRQENGKPQLPSAGSGGKLQAITQTPGPRRPDSAAQPAATTPTAKTVKTVNQHPTIQSSAILPSDKPAAATAPATKRTRQQRVTHESQPSSKAPAAPAKEVISHPAAQPSAPPPAPKSQGTPAPKATPKAQAASTKPVVSHAVTLPPAPKPAAKPQPPPPLAKPQSAPAPKAIAKPQPAPAPKPSAKPQAAPTPRAQPAPAPKSASKSQAPAKPAAKPTPKPPANSQARKSKDKG